MSLLGKSNRRSYSPCSVRFLLIFLVAAILAVDAFNDGISNRSPNRHQAANANNNNNSRLSHQQTMPTAKNQKMDDGDDASAPDLQPIRAGFIGCGTIASAIATGLATPDHGTYLAQHGLSLSSISVTRRSEGKSTKLKEDFGAVVTVYESAEDVVKNSDVVFLCVLPQHVDTVLEDLTKKCVWRPEEHTLVSLVSTSVVESLIQKSGLPRNQVFKMICLPAIAKREGCALLQPAPAPTPTDNNNNNSSVGTTVNVKSMLEALGGCVECVNDDIMNTMMVTTAQMGPIYGVMRNNRDWLVKQGVSPKDASYFVGRTYLSITQDAERDCEDPKRFDALVEEQTPGGLNEQSLRNLEAQGVLGSYDQAMDAVFSRLQGKSDGSLPSTK